MKRKKSTLSVDGPCPVCGKETFVFARTGGELKDIVQLDPPRCLECLKRHGSGKIEKEGV